MTTKNSNTNYSKGNRSTNRRNTTSKNTSRGNSNRNSKNYDDSYNDNYEESSYDSESSRNYSDDYPSKGSNNDHYSENNYSKGSSQYESNESLNNPPYDDYDNNYNNGKGSSNGNNSNYNDNYDSENNYSKNNNRYESNEPINDPPYDDYNNNHNSGKGSDNGNNSNYNDNYERNNYSENTNEKQGTPPNDETLNDNNYNRVDNSNYSYNKGDTNSNYSDNNENYNNNYEDFSNSTHDSGYTSKGGGNDDNNQPNNAIDNRESHSQSNRQTSSRGIRGFIERFGAVRFRNSNDINRFFAENSNSPDFMHWFKDNIGGRSHWRERSLRNISQQDAHSFNMVWDRIPYLFRGRNENYSINLFQFFGLVSIMINEVGSRFTPIRERGSLSYMFNTVIPATARRPQRRKTSYNNPRNNMTAYQLFNDQHFLQAHSGMPRYNLVANTRNRAWHGTEYPRGVVTRPSAAGIIAEADFYKFSGRGLIQTTWSRSYIRLIEHTLHYNGNNPIILEYKNEWQRSLDRHGSLRIIASQTKNRDWDRLFMETQNEFACIAVYKFQEHRDRFLEAIEVNANRLQGNGVGSLYYVGYKVGGRSSYGNKVKDRCLQMINKLLEHPQN